MFGLGFIWALVPSTVKWIGLSVLIGLIGVGAWKWEHAAKLKAEAKLETAQTAAAISQQQILLYQEREVIKEKAAKKRGQLNEMQRENNLDGLADDFNSPGGVRRDLHTNPPGSTKAPARYKDASGAGPEYEEAS